MKVANQRFIVHLHESGDMTCESCSVAEDRSNLIPLLESEAVGQSSAQSMSNPITSTGHAPMSEHEAKTFTKEEKKQNFRSNMQSLRKNLLTGGGGSSSGSATATKPVKIQQARTDSTGTSEDDTNAPISEIQQPRYVDRAKLRRSIHPPSHGLSDADPPHLNKRSRPSSPPLPPKPAEPSYGPGAALFQKMLHNNTTADSGNAESGNESSSSVTRIAESSTVQTQPIEVKMGKVIEVRTMAERSAGLGSGSIREGVEQHSNPTDWRDVAKQRRWREANR